MGEQAVADTLVLPKQLELTPALRNLIETVIPSGSHCLNVGRRARALNVWLTRHGCTHVTADESHMPALPSSPRRSTPPCWSGCWTGSPSRMWRPGSCTGSCAPGGCCW